MTDIASNLLVIAFLFYVLSRAADLVVINVRRVGERLQLNFFFQGMLLGLFTTFPEFSVAINAAIQDVPVIALGNLLGGIMVLFGLVLGLSLVFHRSVSTNQPARVWLGAIACLLAPLVLSLDGHLTRLDGMILIGLYCVVLFYLSRQRSETAARRPAKNDLIPAIFWMVAGLALVIIASNVIVRTTVVLLSDGAASWFIVGLLVFAIGTNLPEITITIRSWRRNIRDLSVSFLIGSALAHVCVLGLLAFMRPLPVKMDVPFIITAGYLTVLLLSLYWFARTDRRLTRKEGMVLLAVYNLFVATQLLVLSG